MWCSESVVLSLECRTGYLHYKPVLKWTWTSLSSLSLSNTFDETHYRMPWGWQWATWPHPAKRGWNRKEMEQWPWKQDCHHISLSLLCPIPVTGTDIGSSYNPEFMSVVFKGMCFWWAESSRSHWISPHRGLIQPAKVRKLNSADGETLPAASCCRLSLLPTNSHVWTGTHTHIHTRSDVCEIWKAYSRETHLISVSVITIIIGTPLHRVRGWRTGIE